jgi:hypothetical protein
MHLHNKNQKKKSYRNATIVYALHFALNMGGIFAQSLCYYLSFVFPANLIWLLHCNAMHFDIVRSFKFILKVGVEDSIVNLTLV